MLITTSMLSIVWNARPIRNRTIYRAIGCSGSAPSTEPLAQLAGASHVLPVVKPHVTRNQRPLADLGTDAHDRMGRADGDAGDVLVEPRAHLVAHDAHALRLVRLDGEPVDELIE